MSFSWGPFLPSRDQGLTGIAAEYIILLMAFMKHDYSGIRFQKTPLWCGTFFRSRRNAFTTSVMGSSFISSNFKFAFFASVVFFFIVVKYKIYHFNHFKHTREWHSSYSQCCAAVTTFRNLFIVLNRSFVPISEDRLFPYPKPQVTSKVLGSYEVGSTVADT